VRLRTFHAPHAPGKINVTPMIDVVMVLIVFYLLVGKLAGDRRPAMALPTSAASAEDAPAELAPIIINVRTGSVAGTVEVDQQTLALPGLETLLRTAPPGRAVLVRAPRETPWGEVDAVVRTARVAGRRVQLATEASR